MNIADELLLNSQMRWDETRINIFREFRDLFENDYTDIIKLLKKYYLNKPFSENGLEERHFQHHDIIQRILTRQNSGIYDKVPKRELIIGEDSKEKKTDEYFSQVLTYLNYNEKMKESLRKARFFNIAELQVAYRNKAIELDIYTPDYYSVKTDKDYLKAIAYLIQKVDENGVFYYTYWSKDKYYFTDSFGNIVKGANNEENKYGVLPFSTLRMREMSDYFGEPDWGLFLSQLAIDMILTDKDHSDFLNRNPILFGVNTNIADNQRVGAGTVIQKEHKQPNIPGPTLNYVSSSYDSSKTEDSIEWRIQSEMRNQNIVGASAQLDQSATSGASKEMDEVGLREERDSVINTLHRFEIKNLYLIRKIWNFHVQQNDLVPNEFIDEIKLIPEGKFEVVFRTDEKDLSIDEKIKLREYEKTNYLKDEVTIVMEELGKTEEEAIDHINNMKSRLVPVVENKGQTLRDKLMGNINA